MKDKHRIILAKKELCTGCGACASVCPKGCIQLVEDEEGFLQPKIDKEACIRCHQCENTCPVLNPPMIPVGFETQAFAAVNMDEKVRMRSSSGGVFRVLANNIVEQGGVVFGARFDKNWEVVHDCAETIEGVEAFMRSKYVQSRVGDTYRQAKQFLEQGRQVLYSGTPCQIGGLHKYLGKDYPNLLSVDLVCHGVPSPKVWRKYLSWYTNGERVVDVNFRDKENGWRGYSMFVATESTIRREKRSTNQFMAGFLKDIYLRRSCYNCKFRSVHRIADITLADYWGVHNVCPEMHDDKGTSIVFVHSNKAMEVLESVRDKMKLCQQDVGQAAANNPPMTCSMQMPLKRKDFFNALNLFGFKVASYYIWKDPLRVRFARKLKKLL